MIEAVTALGAWALKHWKLAAVAVAMLALGVMLFLARSDAAHWKAQDGTDVAALNLEVAKHAVTRASLGTCVASIDKINGATQQLADEATARAEAARKAIASAQEATRSAEADARTLEASAAKSGSTSACRGSTAYSATKGEL